MRPNAVGGRLVVSLEFGNLNLVNSVSKLREILFENPLKCSVRTFGGLESSNKSLTGQN